MKKTVTVIFLVLATLNFVEGQVTLKEENEITNFEELSTESVFVHFNSSVLLVGEYLYYRFYCLNNGLGHLSEMSKVGYVELIGMEGETVFKHKIALKNGLGNGDFFIPTTVKSGSYKLVAYTNWMRNGEKESFFAGEITIINPYNGDDSKIKSKRSKPTDSLQNTPTKQGRVSSYKKVEDYQDGYPITLSLAKDRFAKREKATLKLLFTEVEDIDFGHYSLSVRKKNLIPEPAKQTATNFIKNSLPKPSHYSSDAASSVYLPELRGELVSGWVSSNKAQATVKNLKIGVSIPGENYLFKVIMTDAVGRFHFSIGDNYTSEKMIFQVLEQNSEDYKVQLRENPIDYSYLDFHRVELDSSMREVILNRSIHNQIENAFYAFRPDSVLATSPIQFLEKKQKKEYVLDDFTRFKSVQETIVEILPEVSVKSVKNNKSKILIQGFDNVSASDLPPLILLDGFYIQDHDRLLEFDARKIKKLSVFRHQFIFGPQLFRGALVINTNEGSDYEQFYDDTMNSYSEIGKAQLGKRYFVQRYDELVLGQKPAHLPDDRLQLLWMPRLNVDSKETTIEFYTSDVSGAFEVSLEGFTEKNEPVSVKKTIYVE